MFLDAKAKEIPFSGTRATQTEYSIWLQVRGGQCVAESSLLAAEKISFLGFGPDFDRGMDNGTERNREPIGD